MRRQDKILQIKKLKLAKLSKKKVKKPTPKVTEEGLLELENIHKNLITEGRKLNSNGGLQKMLGE